MFFNTFWFVTWLILMFFIGNLALYLIDCRINRSKVPISKFFVHYYNRMWIEDYNSDQCFEVMGSSFLLGLAISIISIFIFNFPLEFLGLVTPIIILIAAIKYARKKFDAITRGTE